jgi:hypothetical protein
LNADWIKAAERLSPGIIIESLESTNKEVYNIFKKLDLFAEAVYPVSWAGENKSFNWFDIAREYTERWLHQQQIRDATGNRELLVKKFYFPFLDIFMRAWPVTMNGKGHEGMILKTVITGEGGGAWFLKKKNGNWLLSSNDEKDFIAETIIDGNEAWKLFSKSLRKEDIKNKFEIKGDLSLGERVLEMISVMA